MFLRNFFRKKLLANHMNKVYRASVSMIFYAATGTILTAMVYFFFGLKLLSAFIAFGGLTFFTALVVYMKNYYKTGIVIALIAVTIISVAGDIIIGIECSAHYFLLAGVMLFVTVDRTTTVFRYICGAACFFVFVMICVLLIGAQPVTVLSPVAIAVIDKINIVIAFMAIGVSLYNYVSAVDDQETVHKDFNLKLLGQANSDPLTGLPNRRFTYKQLEFLAAKANSRNTEFVVGLADIDDFKHLNDTYGHLCGDEVLVQAGVIMKNAMRKSDIVGRWGGEEFLIILPNTGLEEGLVIIERLRNALEQETFLVDGQKITITMTIGVSVFSKTCALKELIRIADARLYKGKSLGKNCVMECD